VFFMQCNVILSRRSTHRSVGEPAEGSLSRITRTHPFFCALLNDFLVVQSNTVIDFNFHVDFKHYPTFNLFHFSHLSLDRKEIPLDYIASWLIFEEVHAFSVC
jgi:hypothetical protein